MKICQASNSNRLEITLPKITVVILSLNHQTNHIVGVAEDHVAASNQTRGITKVVTEVAEDHEVESSQTIEMTKIMNVVIVRRRHTLT